MQTLRENTTLQGGKYRIISVLGQGGFGITYLAEQTMLERRVAIKEFYMKELCGRDGSTSHVTIGTEGSRETVTRFREKFLKEARNIAKLSHPNIVKVIDVFEENGTAYYVMEYAEGGSLADKVKRESYLTEPVATRYILQVAEALAYVHAKKMNHLDVKPANIMLTGTDTAVLIDFGLSKQYNVVGQQTSTTPVGISEGYAPMEQYKQGGVGEFSPETDIYALGATFFKLLTGITPPSASDVNEDGVPIDELKAKGVSEKAIEVICETMKSRKKERMRDAKGFIDALKENSKQLLITTTKSSSGSDNGNGNEGTILVNKTSNVHDIHKAVQVVCENSILSRTFNSLLAKGKLDQTQQRKENAKIVLWILLGLLTIVAVFMLVAFVSYLFTGEADYSLLESHTDPLNSGLHYKNVCGSWGAIVASFFLNDLFGLASFIIPPYLIILGLRLMRVFKFALVRNFILMTVPMLWTSVFLSAFGYLFPYFEGSFVKLGGNHGIQVVKFLTQLVGTQGLLAVLAITAVLYLIYVSTKRLIKNV